MAERSLVQTLEEVGEYSQWDWSRLNQQVEFLTAPEEYTLISGGFGSGKTSILCAKTLALMFFIPNNLGYLGRMDGKSLRASTLQTLLEMLPKEYIAKKNDQQGFMQLIPEVGGSRLVYGDFKDLNDFKNIPLGFFAIDQMEEVPEDIFKFLMGRLRRQNPVLTETGKRQYWVVGECSSGSLHHAWEGDTRCRICTSPLPAFDLKRLPKKEPPWRLISYRNYGFGAANPEGPSHWIFKWFKGLPGPQGLSEGKKDFDCRSINVTLYDGLNAGFVGDKYVHDLELVYTDPMMYDRYIMGKWVEAEGLVFPNWKREHHIIPREAAKNYLGLPLFNPWDGMYEFIDHGFSAPTAIGWTVVQRCDCGCEKDNFYIVDTYSKTEKPVSDHAIQIKARREQLTFPLLGTYLDAQAFSKNQSGTKGSKWEDKLFSIADEFNDCGIFPIPNQKDWDAGHNRILELLALDPTHVHPLTGIRGAAHLFVLSHNIEFIEQIESYKWKKVKNALNFKEDPQDGKDDFMDGLNGFVASRPSATHLALSAPTYDIEAEMDSFNSMSNSSMAL